MASIYEKPPLSLLEKSFDEKNLPKEVYKMQNKDLRFNKLKAEVHIDSGQLGVEFTVNKTIPDFNKGAKKIHLTGQTPSRSLRMSSRDSIRRPGNRSCTTTSRSRSTQLWYPPSMIACWRRTFAVRLSCSQRKLCTKRSPGTANTSIWRRAATTRSERRSPQNPSTIFIDGRRCCAWRNRYPRATSRSPP
jgi:hypothetical protein